MRVSIIIPMYHAEKFVVQCLDSLEAQTFRDFEVICVVDDVSADKTVWTIFSHDLYKRGNIKLMTSSSKSSPAKARNKALPYVGGEYVCFLDVDDWWEPQKLEKQLASIGDADVSFTSGVWHRDFGNLVLRTDDETFNKHFVDCIFVWSSVMFKRSALLDVLVDRKFIFNDQPQCDDGELLIYMHKHGYKFKMEPEVLVHIIEHGSNLTQGNLWKPNWWAARNWWKYGYYIPALKHITFGVAAVVSECIGIRSWLRVKRMEWNGAEFLNE